VIDFPDLSPRRSHKRGATVKVAVGPFGAIA